MTTKDIITAFGCLVHYCKAVDYETLEEMKMVLLHHLDTEEKVNHYIEEIKKAIKEK